MRKENDWQVDIQLQRANKTWNFLYETLEKFNHRQKLTLSQKEYIVYSWHRMREIKALLLNIKKLVGENRENFNSKLELEICRKLDNKVKEMIRLIIQLDRIY